MVDYKKKLVLKAFHPTRFEKGVFAVSIHEKGMPYLDRYTDVEHVQARDAAHAIKKMRLKIGDLK